MAKYWRNSKEYKTWRTTAIRRQPWCTVCKLSNHLHVHHYDDASSHPKKRYLQTNACVLCKKCHFSFHIFYKQGYRSKCDKQDMQYFVKLYKALKKGHK